MSKKTWVDTRSIMKKEGGVVLGHQKHALHNDLVRLHMFKMAHSQNGVRSSTITRVNLRS